MAKKTVKLNSEEPSPTEQAGLLKLLTKGNAYLENILKLGGYLLLLLLVVSVVKTI